MTRWITLESPYDMLTHLFECFGEDVIVRYCDQARRVHLDTPQPTDGAVLTCLTCAAWWQPCR